MNYFPILEFLLTFLLAPMLLLIVAIVLFVFESKFRFIPSAFVWGLQAYVFFEFIASSPYVDPLGMGGWAYVIANLGTASLFLLTLFVFPYLAIFKYESLKTEFRDFREARDLKILLLLLVVGTGIILGRFYYVSSLNKQRVFNVMDSMKDSGFEVEYSRGSPLSYRTGPPTNGTASFDRFVEIAREFNQSTIRVSAGVPLSHIFYFPEGDIEVWYTRGDWIYYLYIPK